MYLNSFSVRIPEGQEIDGGYIELEHNTQYRLVLRNARPTRCDARVEIDGKHVGTWRIHAQESITLERPAHDTGRFTFYQIGTSEAEVAGLVPGEPNLGLIKVVFTPELVPLQAPAPAIFRDLAGVEAAEGFGARSAKSDVSGTHAPGGTGLSGHSQQQFVTVGVMDLDYSQQTVIHLRLVSKLNQNQPRPLTSFLTPVPPPIP
jgi:hypothetical protein